MTPTADDSGEISPGRTPSARTPGSVARRLAARATAAGIILFARLVTAVRGVWTGVSPDGGCRVYFANHSSHGDFVLIWTVLPPRLRDRTRAVAASDYWLASGLRRFVGRDVFGVVPIDRTRSGGEVDAVDVMASALDAGDSLILFPEGTRNTTDAALLPFRSGLYRLAVRRPDIELVPVWIDNLNRVLPKGESVPIPLVCTVTFGAALHVAPDESRTAFLARAEGALLALSADAPSSEPPDETPDEPADESPDEPADDGAADDGAANDEVKRTAHDGSEGTSGERSA